MGTDDDTEHVPEVHLVEPSDVPAEIAEHGNAHVAGTHEALEGLLQFVRTVEGTMQVHAPHAPGGSNLWVVRVRWRPLGSAREQVCRGEDATFDGACLLCRGLLAHGLASGNFER